jgi:hypothetical protein
LLAAVAAFVHWYKEPTLARRFGAEYEADRKQARLVAALAAPHAGQLRRCKVLDPARST